MHCLVGLHRLKVLGGWVQGQFLADMQARAAADVAKLAELTCASKVCFCSISALLAGFVR